MTVDYFVWTRLGSEFDFTHVNDQHTSCIRALIINYF
jgi:hypothetical protein